jgi:hypothetical protein
LLYNEIIGILPDFSGLSSIAETHAALDNAADALKKAGAARTERSIIQHCEAAMSFCSDFPGIEDLAAKNPPQPPANLGVVADGDARTTSVRWEKSPSEGTIHYNVVRRRDAAPANVSDGELLGRTPGCEFVDTQPQAATNYYYAVFAERIGVFSTALADILPVANLFEVSGISIVVGDGSLELAWDDMQGGAEAEICRKADGSEEIIHKTTETSFVDRGLENDKLYSYVVRLAYDIYGVRRLTPGSQASGVPMKLPKPVGRLAAVPDDEDTYLATWANPERVSVVLYSSKEKPAYQFGEVVSQRELEKTMHRLTLERASDESAVFHHRGKERLYVAATTMKSGSVVFGSLLNICREDLVSIETIAKVNGKLNIHLKAAPKDAAGFAVMYRFDRYPHDIGDAGSRVEMITLKQFQHNGALILETLEPVNYYFSVFAIFNRDGETEYSPGANYMFRNAEKAVIYYDISKKLTGRAAVISFEAEKPDFHLPGMDVIYSIGSAPVEKTSDVLCRIDAQVVGRRSVKISVPLPANMARNMYIKPFLTDEALYEMYQLKLKLGSNHKIS